MEHSAMAPIPGTILERGQDRHIEPHVPDDRAGGTVEVVRRDWRATEQRVVDERRCYHESGHQAVGHRDCYQRTDESAADDRGDPEGGLGRSDGEGCILLEFER